MAGEPNALYVAPDGSDGNPGTRAKPFATLEGARDAIRALKKAGGLPEGGATVVIRGGVYERKNTFALTRADSGTPDAPVVYRAARKHGGVHAPVSIGAQEHAVSGLQDELPLVVERGQHPLGKEEQAVRGETEAIVPGKERPSGGIVGGARHDVPRNRDPVARRESSDLLGMELEQGLPGERPHG